MTEEKLTEANGCRLDPAVWVRVNDLASTLGLPVTVLMRIAITLLVEELGGKMKGARLARWKSKLALERGRPRARKRRDVPK